MSTQAVTGTRGGFSAMMASNQWAYRPDEEKFESTAALKAHLEEEAVYTRDVSRHLGGLKFHLDSDNQPRIGAAGDSNSGGYLSHWAFDQLASMTKLPAEYLRTLETQNPQLLLDNLNFGMGRVEGEDKRLLVRVGEAGSQTALIRAINGKNFGRVMDLDLIDRIMEVEKQGWRVPPARPVREGQTGSRIATEADCLKNRSFGLSIKPGDMIAPAGTYYGDRSSFYIRVNEESGKSMEVGGQQLFRMLIIQNSEVGAGYWEVYLAWLVAICGNHILHGVQDLKQMRIRHVGAAAEKVQLAFGPQIIDEGKDSRVEDRMHFEAARLKVLGPGKVEVVESLFEKRVAPKKTLEAAWLRAEQHEGWYGAPNTAWGMAMGLSEVSQESKWQDKRREVDEAAAKVLRLAAN